MVSGFQQDLRCALRGVHGNGSAAVVIVLTLAIGIGVVTASFAVVDAVLLRTIVPDQHRVVRIWKRDLQRADFPLALTFHEFEAWRDQAWHVAALGAIDVGGATMVPIGLEEATVPARLAVVSAGFFDVVFPRPPLRGRWFEPADDRPGVEIPVVVSERFERRVWNRRSSFVGQRLSWAGGRSVTVVGVAPDGFDYPLGADIWAPIARVYDGRDGRFDAASREFAQFHIVGRLAPGVSLQGGRAGLDVIHRRVVAAFPADYQQMPVVVTPLIESVTGESGRVLLLVLASAGLVFVIAGVNVTALLLMRAWSRQHEVAVRAALGASATRLFRQSLTESVVLAVPGAVCGLALAVGLLAVVRWLDPTGVPRIENAAIDIRALGSCVAAAIVWVVALGSVPAVAHHRLARAPGTGDTLRTVRGTRRLAGFTVVQVAAAVVIAVGSGLLVRTFVHLRAIDRGFDARQLVLASVLLPEERARDPRAMLQFYGELLPQITAMPGVTSAAPVHLEPGSGSAGLSAPMIFEGQTPADARGNPWSTWEPVLPEYLRTLDIPIVRGRAFTAADRRDNTPVAIVSEATARRYWPNQDPVGRRLQFVEDSQFPWVTVVGVAADTKYRELTKTWLTVYFPAEQFFFFRPATLVIRTTAAPEALAPLLRERLGRVDPGAVLSRVTTMDAALAIELSRPLTAFTVTGLFALTAIALAAIGVYGVFAFEVAKRRRELAVRSVVGATPLAILAMVVTRGVAVAGSGVLLGLIVAAAAVRALEPLLFGVGAWDTMTFVAAGIAVLVVSIGASCVPARQAAATDPAVALRPD